MLHLYNTLERKKQKFIPLKNKKASVYTCGPTVYDFAHIGNLSSYLFSDLLKRYLRYSGLTVVDVMNITDIDDKTIRNSRQKQISLKKYTRGYEKLFIQDLKTLKIDLPKHLTRASDYILEMQKIIKKLIVKGFAYIAEDKSVYFSIKKFKKYGQLANLKQLQLKVGASGRINTDEYLKDNVADFVLWKAWDKADGNNKWDSPWGPGRPGWHIECSAMSMKHLGETIDIHTGGEDLIFPHHQNEIAQSEAVTGKQFVRYWLHRAYLKVDGKKMSKSLGNFFTLKQILEKQPDPMAFRYLILTSHYRTPINFTLESLRSAENSLNNIRKFIFKLKKAKGSGKNNFNLLLNKLEKDFQSAMDDDLNTPQAIAGWFEFQKLANGLLEKGLVNRFQVQKALNIIKKIDLVWGFLLSQAPKNKIDKKKINDLIAKRNVCRQNKDYAGADQIRAELQSMGIEIQDQGDKTVWVIK